MLPEGHMEDLERIHGGESICDRFPLHFRGGEVAKYAKGRCLVKNF